MVTWTPTVFFHIKKKLKESDDNNLCYSLFKDLFNFSYYYSILNRYLSSLEANNSIKISFISQTRILMANFILQGFF